MTKTKDIPTEQAKLDPAAVLGCAMSLYNSCHVRAKATGANLSEAYHGGDEFMRVCMRIATHFETWACTHINFNELNDVWPYMLEDKFGDTCRAYMGGVEALQPFTDADCAGIAKRLKLPIL